MVRLQAKKIVTHRNQLQTITNQAVISVTKLLRIIILQKETAANFLKGNEFKAILPDLKKL